MKNSSFRGAVLGGCLLLLGAGVLAAQDWPQWRGPNRDGKLTGFTPPQTWPTNFTRKWQAVVGRGDSSPALVGGWLYTFGRQDADEVVQCLDAATGQTNWQARYPAGFVVTGPSSAHPGTRSSPVAAGGRVCALGVGGILSCLDAATGKLVWRKQSTNDYLGAGYRFESSMSPIVVDKLCIVHIGGKGAGTVFAFDLAGGEFKWRWDGDAPASSSPVVMAAGGRKQLVTITAKNVVGLDLADGRLLWETPFEASQGGNTTTPVVDGETVVCTGQGKGMFAIKIEQLGGNFTAAPLWKNPQLGARFTTPVLKDGLLYGYTGKFFCASATNGAILWTSPSEGAQSASVLDAGSVLLALTLKGDFIAFRPGAAEYNELARIKVAGSETWAHPVVAGKKIYVKDTETVSLWIMD